MQPPQPKRIRNPDRTIFVVVEELAHASIYNLQFQALQITILKWINDRQCNGEERRIQS